MSNCPKCEKPINILGHDIEVYGVDTNLKALYCSKCMTLITIIPVGQNKNYQKNLEPRVSFI